MKTRETSAETGAGSPTIVVGGVLVSGGREAGRGKGRKRRPRGLLGVLAAALLVLGAIFLGSGILSSCSAGIGAEIDASGRAEISIAAEVPLAIGQKLRRLSSLPDDSPLFDLEALRASLAARKGLSIDSLRAPSPESLRANLSVRKLAELLSAPDIANPGILLLQKKGEELELSLRFERGQGRALAELLPGLDPYLVEALAPPALEEEPLSAAEYRQMLSSLFGERLMPALEAASISLRISVPGTVSASKGGKLEGRTLAIAIPILELLVLEKPLEYSIRWRN